MYVYIGLPWRCVIHRNNHANPANPAAHIVYMYITVTNKSAMIWNCVNESFIYLSIINMYIYFSFFS